jgi:hypothetical protein
MTTSIHYSTLHLLHPWPPCIQLIPAYFVAMPVPPLHLAAATCSHSITPVPSPDSAPPCQPASLYPLQASQPLHPSRAPTPPAPSTPLPHRLACQTSPPCQKCQTSPFPPARPTSQVTRLFPPSRPARQTHPPGTPDLPMRHSHPPVANPPEREFKVTAFTRQSPIHPRPGHSPPLHGPLMLGASCLIRLTSRLFGQGFV